MAGVGMPAGAQASNALSSDRGALDTQRAVLRDRCNSHATLERRRSMQWFRPSLLVTGLLGLRGFRVWKNQE